ncbi:hypothetical protein [Pollutimonas sp. M17]|uniref:hypothetical protein n=1 Tax=Pollutimonas sp. M17 TaxID=2962065 RepID=UPI0021F3D211|nr:hypothetical protein [Pollutimonas sp. M17]UYO92330.1 hypothetical protein OEG81_10375 [Pollutimonas sp. M17]HWK70061.1 hypothetical protein [Burkholderiaceae bacterium]
MDIDQTGRLHALRTLAGGFALGFKFLAWTNGLGVLLLLCWSLGIVQIDLDPQWLRFPMAAFLAGLALAALGLLWSYPVQSSLLHQLLTGRPRRSHWLPLFCTLVAYSLSLLAFIAACWFTQSLAVLTY